MTGTVAGASAFVGRAHRRNPPTRMNTFSDAGGERPSSESVNTRMRHDVLHQPWLIGPPDAQRPIDPRRVISNTMCACTFHRGSHAVRRTQQRKTTYAIRKRLNGSSSVGRLSVGSP